MLEVCRESRSRGTGNPESELQGQHFETWLVKLSVEFLEDIWET